MSCSTRLLWYSASPREIIPDYESESKRKEKVRCSISILPSPTMIDGGGSDISDESNAQHAVQYHDLGSAIEGL